MYCHATRRQNLCRRLILVGVCTVSVSVCGGTGTVLFVLLDLLVLLVLLIVDLLGVFTLRLLSTEEGAVDSRRVSLFVGGSFSDCGALRLLSGDKLWVVHEFDFGYLLELL